MNKLLQIELAHSRRFFEVMRALNQQYLLGGEKAQIALQEFDRKRLQIKHGQLWAAENAPHEGAAAQLCVAYSRDTQDLLNLSLPLPQRQHWYKVALAAARQQNLQETDLVGFISLLRGLGQTERKLGNVAQSLKYLTESLNLAFQTNDTTQIANAYLDLSSLYFSQSDYAQAAVMCQEGLKLVLPENENKVGYSLIALKLLTNLGTILTVQGQYEQAEQYLLQALTLAISLTHKGQEPTSLSTLYLNLGSLNHSRGNHAQALKYMLEGLAVARKSSSLERVSLILSNLGMLYSHQDNYQQALKYLEEGLELARQIGFPEIRSSLLSMLAMVLYKLGQAGQAEALLIESLALARSIGQAKLISDVSADLGLVFMEQGDFNKAEVALQEALNMAREMAHLHLTVIALTRLGLLKAKTGIWGEATVLLEEGQALARQTENDILKSEVLLNSAELQLKLQQPHLAQTLLEEALELARKVNSPRLIAAAHLGLARTTLALGNGAVATEHYQQSLNTFRAIGHFRAAEVRQEWANLRTTRPIHNAFSQNEF